MQKGRLPCCSEPLSNLITSNLDLHTTMLRSHSKAESQKDLPGAAEVALFERRGSASALAVRGGGARRDFSPLSMATAAVVVVVVALTLALRISRVPESTTAARALSMSTDAKKQPPAPKKAAMMRKPQVRDPVAS